MIVKKCIEENLEIEFSSPTTNHELSDDVAFKYLVKKIINFGMTIKEQK